MQVEDITCIQFYLLMQVERRQPEIDVDLLHLKLEGGGQGFGMDHGV